MRVPSASGGPAASLPAGAQRSVGLAVAASQHLAMEEGCCPLTGLGLAGLADFASWCQPNGQSGNFAVYFYMEGSLQSCKVPLMMAKTKQACSLKCLRKLAGERDISLASGDSERSKGWLMGTKIPGRQV